MAIASILLLPILLLTLQLPYDAVPDQDLLWVSEGLRLWSGRGPSYADHPGIFWSIFDAIILLLKQISGNKIIDSSSQSASLTLIKQLVVINRICNYIIVVGMIFLFEKILCLLQARTWLKLSASLALIGSSGTLLSISSVRNELTSVFFLCLYIVLDCHVYLNFALLYRKKKLFLMMPPLVFLISAYCKQQVMMLTPFAFLTTSLIKFSLSKDQKNIIDIFKTWIQDGKVYIIAIILYLAISYPDIDLKNIPFWIVMILGLCASLQLNSGARSSGKYVKTKSLMSIAVLFIFCNRILAANWWRKAVIGFPFWMRQFSIEGDSMQSGYLLYQKNIFIFAWPSLLLMFMILGTLACQKFTLFTEKNRALQFNRMLCAAIILLSAMAVQAAFSFRAIPRYEIYILIPLLVSVITLMESRLKILKISACLLISMVAVKGCMNLISFQDYVRSQSRSSICVAQHMDRLMANTSTGMCPNFSDDAKNKSAYDGWHDSPR